MKNTSLTLNLNDDIESFFKHSRLYAVFSSLQAYALCNRLNTALGLNFKRDRSEDNYDIHSTTQKPQTSQSLFDTIEETPPPIFPVFKNALAGSKVQMIVYANKSEGQRLLLQYSTADFFLLIRNFHLSIFEDKGIDVLSQIEGINAVRALEINQLKQKSNLIVQEPEADWQY